MGLNAGLRNQRCFIVLDQIARGTQVPSQSRSGAFTNCDSCLVRKSALFQGVPYARLKWTQHYRTNQIQVKAKGNIYIQDREPGYAYTLYSGWVALYKVLANGDCQILKYALPGDLLGFHLSGEGKATHGARAITDVVLCAFPVANLSEMLSKEPEVSARLLAMHMRDMAICQQHLICAGKKDARQRLAYLLLETLNRVRRQAPGDYTESDNSFFFPVTQDHIGDTLGLTSIHVNRTLKLLKKENLIGCSHRRISILDEAKLSEIAEFDVSLLDTHPLI